MAKPVDAGKVARQTLECAEKLEAYTALLRGKPPALLSPHLRALLEARAEVCMRGLQPLAHTAMRGVPLRLVLPA